MKVANLVGAAAVAIPFVTACDSCFGPINHVEHVRHVKRIQPGAQNATYGPTRGLEWGQFNVIHTTDTHGWLEGHIKQANYGADCLAFWILLQKALFSRESEREANVQAGGDFVSFVKHLKQQASKLGVDLLLVDTGDLHDGTGLSDATDPDGEVSNQIFDQLDAYDMLTIGNHELYYSNIAYQDFNEFSKFWGDRYITSNVQILNPNTSAWEYIGSQYKYFTTAQGLRIMAFGVLYDFTGNTNVSKVIPAATLVQQDWFLQAVNYSEPIDMFLILGHNPARPSASSSTFGTIHEAIRAVHNNTPIQIFGGHSHVRDFAVLDQSSTALEAGRYCETVGWFSMSGFSSENSGYNGVTNPYGVSNPTRKATNTSTSPFVYSRRYLDWNRYTFMYHAIGAQNASQFDYPSGLNVSAQITADRTELNLGTLYGCVPNTYCMTCAPFGDELNIYTVLSDALGTVVVNTTRNDTARIIIANTGGVRYDMYKGPFTYDDNFIVSPFTDVFLYIPDVPYSLASTMLSGLNAGGASKEKRWASASIARDSCVDPILAPLSGIEARGDTSLSGVTRRQVTETSGYTTSDDFGTDGDDTAHTAIPSYDIPDYFQGIGGFPKNGTPSIVDLIFIDYIEDYVLDLLGSNYTSADITYYINSTYSTQDYLIPFVQEKWQAGLPDCPIS